jgi:hypothetical protein
MKKWEKEYRGIKYVVCETGDVAFSYRLFVYFATDDRSSSMLLKDRGEVFRVAEMMINCFLLGKETAKEEVYEAMVKLDICPEKPDPYDHDYD